MSQINPQNILDLSILKPCEFTKVQQVGIDLTVSEELIIPHGQAKNVLLNEEVYLPIDIYATLTHRSSYNRKGVLITGSIYDPNYRGQIGCTIYNLSGQELVIPKNERIAQMLFFSADAASAYCGQYMNEGLQLKDEYQDDKSLPKTMENSQ